MLMLPLLISAWLKATVGSGIQPMMSAGAPAATAASGDVGEDRGPGPDRAAGGKAHRAARERAEEAPAALPVLPGGGCRGRHATALHGRQPPAGGHAPALVGGPLAPHTRLWSLPLRLPLRLPLLRLRTTQPHRLAKRPTPCSIGQISVQFRCHQAHHPPTVICAVSVVLATARYCTTRAELGTTKTVPKFCWLSTTSTWSTL